MNYKSIFMQCHEDSVQGYSSLIDKEMKCMPILKFNNIEEDYPFEQCLLHVQNQISNMYIPYQNTIENSFYLPNDVSIESILNCMISIFRTEKLKIEDVQKYHFFEFICYILNEINEKVIVYKATQIFINIYRLDKNVINSAGYVTKHFYQYDSFLDDNFLKILRFLFESNEDYAVKILNEKSYIVKIINSIKSSDEAIICSRAIKLARTIFYEARINEAIGELVEREFIEQVAIFCLQYITKNRDYITKEALKLFHILSLNESMLSIAMGKGLDKSIILALNSLPDEYMSLLYLIIINIFDFVINGSQIKTKITSHPSFFEKTAQLIKNTELSDEDFSIIITAIDLLDLNFWYQFLQYNIFDAILMRIGSCKYDHKVRICSLLAHFFQNGNRDFVITFCNESILKVFFQMLDDKSKICFEIIPTLNKLLSFNFDKFYPIFVDYEYDQILECLINDANPELAELAQTEYDHFISYK